MQSVQELSKQSFTFKYTEDKESLKRFILFFQEEGQYKYMNLLRNKNETLNIEMVDLALYDGSEIVSRVEKNAYSYMNMFYEVIDDILYGEDEYGIEETDDVFLFQRISRLKEMNPEKKITEVFPGQLLRRYVINIISNDKRSVGIREIGAKDIGSLVRVRGVVTRVTEVRPAVKVAAYVCESCGSEIYQEVANETFDMLEECFSEKCKTRKIKGTLSLITRGSRFERQQILQLQELTCDVPQGSIPRILNVQFNGKVTPGEYVTLGGIFMPRPYYGFKKLKAGLLNDVYLYCMDIASISNGMAVEPCNINIDRSVDLDKLISSFAPEIFGMSDVKKILLLMLVGSPEILKQDGMRIRGNINVLLVGDPGVAKSQLLKTVSRIARRGIYTSGKGNSAAGLTAAVVRDTTTGEVVLEGGALVLSDGGVCCIDELDKMNELDRVSIHEVMEQQTVSIAKAGINVTLNARCSVLAAANPKGDFKKSIEQTLGLPTSLISRFDVICLLKDSSNLDNDLALATHVTSLHLDEPAPPVDYSFLRAYIDQCKSINTVLSFSTRNKLLEAYLKARKTTTATPRYLLALIRLTLAHARLRMSSIATEEDAVQAIYLLELMKITTPTVSRVSLKKEIYDFIMSLSDSSSKVSLSTIFALSKYSRSEIEDVIEEFKKSGIWIEEDGNLIIVN